MNDLVKNLLLALVIGLVMMTVYQSFSGKMGIGASVEEVEYSKFIDDVYGKNIKSVEFSGESTGAATMLKFTTNDGSVKTTTGPYDRELVNDLVDNRVDIKQLKPSGGPSLFWSAVMNFLPIILFVGIFIYFMRQMQGGGKGGAMSFGRSRAKMQGEDQVKVTFEDVAGCDEAKEEVGELVEFLRDPGRFQKLGGRIPRGILMVGSPGTGKTLLARAIAGEAKVPFFSISGSDFVEMFVGVGASRVRDMFDQAKKHSPCIIFIDEIDAVGRQRGAGLGGVRFGCASELPHLRTEP